MYQKDASIIERSNIQSDVVVVNQCDKNSVEEFDFENKKGEKCHAKFICTTERGLSKSRNMAIRNAWGNICQICDDDEWIEDDAVEKITRAFEENPDAILIAFALKREDIDKSYPEGKRSLGFKQILKTSSLQVTFSRNLMGNDQVWFDEKMGSGTGNGGGEENKFMLDCKRKGLKLMYYPDVIATIKPSPSQWFKGYNEEFMENQGWASRRIMGNFIGFFYCIHYAFAHRHLYDENMTVYKAFKFLIKGYCKKK